MTLLVLLFATVLAFGYEPSTFQPIFDRIAKLYVEEKFDTIVSTAFAPDGAVGYDTIYFDGEKLSDFFRSSYSEGNRKGLFIKVHNVSWGNMENARIFSEFQFYKDNTLKSEESMPVRMDTQMKKIDDELKITNATILFDHRRPSV